MHVEETNIDDVKIVHPSCFPDARGYFMEVYRADHHAQSGLPSAYVQENQSGSQAGVVRGLHFQYDAPMSKIMRVIAGRAFLVAVDIRHGSPTLGRWVGIEASAENRIQLWAPAGFARGFCALSEYAEIQYKCTAIYNPQGESGIRWDDQEIGIQWPVSNPILSEKDRIAQTLREWLDRPESRTFVYQK